MWIICLQGDSDEMSSFIFSKKKKKKKNARILNGVSKINR